MKTNKNKPAEYVCRNHTLRVLACAVLFSLISVSWLGENCYAKAKNYGKVSPLARNFVTPSDSVLTSVYWYWLSGNVTVEGVEKDLEAMKRAGINRAFIGNIGLGDLKTPYKPLKVFSDEWWAVMHAALKKAAELDIEIGIFNCPGWSQAGGPWIESGQAMRYLTTVKAEIEGGRNVFLTLPRPADDFQDVRVLAFPTPGTSESVLTVANAGINAVGVQGEAGPFIDGDPKTEARFDGSAECIIDITAKNDFVLRNVTMLPSFSPIHADVELLVKQGNEYRKLISFIIDRTNPNVEVGFEPYAPVSVSVPPTAGREFRINIKGAGKNTGLREIALSSVPRVERYAEKTLAKMFQSPLPYWEEYQWRRQPEPDDTGLTVAPGKVMDVSAFLYGDTLRWNAPAGRWTIMRMGMRPTGIMNSPAAPEGTGLEVDKMTTAYLQHHFDHFIGEILQRIPPDDRKTFRVVVADSYEKGGQNFSDTFLDDFEKRYGYDPLPFLPVYEGTVVGSQDLSDRFLWDMRRFVADCLAYAHIGGMRETAHKHGLTLWLENYGHWGFPGEFLQYGGQSDEVSGEFWSEGTLGDIENRAASSCAHIYGKTKVSAESFTAAGNDFLRHPAMMKPRGDRFFAEGINNTLLHVYISQPDDIRPGMNAWFGNEFNRNNTWFSHMDLFTRYLKRCNYMLQQGLNVADVAYFIGEDAPKMTGIAEPSLPNGYQFDYINGEVLLERMTVKDGMWTLPHGTQYRILVLPKLTTMRPELLSRLQQLVMQGGILLGPPPQRSPSLQDYPQADGIVAGISAEMWRDADGTSCKAARYGKGAVLCGMTMEEALDYADCMPDCRFDGSLPLAYNHRDADGRQIYFLTNQSGKRLTFDCTFRTAGKVPELWTPADGNIRQLSDYTCNGRATTVPLVMEPHESMFVVFDKSATHDNGTAGKENFPAFVQLMTLDNDWTLTFEAGGRGPQQPIRVNNPSDLSLSDNDSVRYFSGRINYETTFRMKNVQKKGKIYLNLGEVGVMAKVYVNGLYAGGAWTAPYRVDITDFVKKGKNTLCIDVVNTWVNRLVGDSRLPENERNTWTMNNPWRPESPLQPSGLLKPVVIERMEL